MFAVRSSRLLHQSVAYSVRSIASSNNVIFVLGAPGSGKDSDHLAKKFGGYHVSVGEIFREVRRYRCPSRS